jgi:FkbM family methyltransferase
MINKIESNKQSTLINTVVIDAGARYGLHPSWVEMRGLVDFHLFEMDAEEASRLKRKYQDDERIRIYSIALYSRNTKIKYSARKHQALNSIFKSNDEMLSQNEYKQREFTVTEQMTVDAQTVDSIFNGYDVHFLKLDVEGSEFELLKGAIEKIRSSVLGVRSEVLFAPVYTGAPLFGDIHRLLLDEGLELLNLDYTGAGNKAGRFTQPGRYGKLLSSDAVWVVGNDRLFSAKGKRLAEDIIRLAIFLMLNGATDLAIDILDRAVNREDVTFGPYFKDPLFLALHRKVLMLFKSLLDLPMLLESDITNAYKAIFGREFPLMNQFYQSDLLE